jgi:hypothetical protein
MKSNASIRLLNMHRARNFGLKIGVVALALLAAKLISFAQPAESVRPNLLAFGIIESNNIFNGSRLPTRPTPTRVIRTNNTPVVQADYISLVGEMDYEKGAYAFFEGSRSAWNQVLQLSNTIAGFKLVDVNANYVDLVSNSVSFRLPVGAQLRQERGAWRVDTTQVASLDTSSSYTTMRGGGTTGGRGGGGGRGGRGGGGMGNMGGGMGNMGGGMGNMGGGRGGRGGGGGGGGRNATGASAVQPGTIQPGTAAAAAAALNAGQADAMSPDMTGNNFAYPNGAANMGMGMGMQQPGAAIELPNVPDATATLQNMIQRALEERIAAAAAAAAQDNNEP